MSPLLNLLCIKGHSRGGSAMSIYINPIYIGEFLWTLFGVNSTCQTTICQTAITQTNYVLQLCLANSRIEMVTSYRMTISFLTLISLNLHKCDEYFKKKYLETKKERKSPTTLLFYLLKKLQQ